MSQPVIQQRLSLADLRARKGKAPMVVLTAYTAPYARILDPYVDMLIVGDSLGMVLYGMENTLGVTMDMMIAHGQAVMRASHKACVVIDMPFGSYQASKEEAFRNCAHVLTQTNCNGLKLEGGVEMAETIAYLTKRGIPVMAHIGLKPQHVLALGSYRYQGRTDEEKAEIMNDALVMEHAGASALLIEGVAEDIAREVTAKVTIPTIGIGASPACDGQVLVTDDMAGLLERTPKFVKQYGNLADALEIAVRAYAEEVKSRKFPTLEYCFGVAKKPA